MSQVFGKNAQPKVEIDRNSFDLSFQNNLTMQLGKIYPVMCKEVLPGDTFKIKPSFGLRFMPMAFPIQTKMRADLHFFYVRNRNLYDSWMNFIGQTGSPEAFPTLSASESLAQSTTSSLGDYLGMPSTLYGNVSEKIHISNGAVIDSNSTLETKAVSPASLFSQGAGASQILAVNLANFNAAKNGNTTIPAQNIVGTNGSNYQLGNSSTYNSYISTPLYINYLLNLPVVNNTSFIAGNRYRFYIGNSVKNSALGGAAITFTHLSGSFAGQLYVSECFSLGKFVNSGNGWFIEFTCIKSVTTNFSTTWLGILFFVPSGTNTLSNVFVTNSNISRVNNFGSGTLTLQASKCTLSIPIVTDFQIVTEDNTAVGSFYDSNSFPYLPSALPFRAYESIYNSFYRDERNNPFIVDGVNDPNKYTFTTAGGIDNNHYAIHSRNWEQDFITSAVPTPMQGNVTPLVGITTSGSASFVSENGDIQQVQFETADDNDTIVSFNADNNVSSDVRRAAAQYASEGISISDLRNVNALTKWLETNIRRGLKYKDQIMSHFGVDVQYDVLDMPEFIGGVSQPVNVSQVDQTSASTEDNPLGSYAGQAYCIGSSHNDIEKYCDEHGFIIACLSVVPTPSYSQLLPKHFLKTHPLDYFSPEFGHLGYQPIKFGEVCPLQAPINNVSLDSTFGYQRAWYDYLASVDEIHGDFRTTLKPFVLTREFRSLPSLSEQFLLVNQNELNEVFTVTEVDGQPVDTILGQVHFDITAKRKIPRFGTPRLE